MLMIRNKGLVFFALVLASFAVPAHSEVHGSIYDLPAKFRLESSDSVSLSKWKGTPLVMTMTYTSCEYACPRIIEKLKNVQKYYDKKKKKAQFIVVTFDPSRDTPEKLKGYQKSTGEIGKNWIFLSGAESDTRKLSMVLGIRFERNPEDGTISHDNKILIINEKGEITQELNGLSADVSELK